MYYRKNSGFRGHHVLKSSPKYISVITYRQQSILRNGTEKVKKWSQVSIVQYSQMISFEETIWEWWTRSPEWIGMEILSE